MNKPFPNVAFLHYNITLDGQVHASPSAPTPCLRQRLLLFLPKCYPSS